MATTDQLRKAERSAHSITLHAYSRERYIEALEASGQTGVRKLSKIELWKRVLVCGINIAPDWHKERGGRL